MTGPGFYDSGGGGGALGAGAPTTPLSAITRALGANPTFHAQGVNAGETAAVDVVSGQDLVTVGAPDLQFPLVALIDGEPPPPLVADPRGYNFNLTTDAIQAQDNTINDIGTGSALLVVTFWLDAWPAPATAVNIAGKRDAGTLDGIELKVNDNGEILCDAKPQGQATSFAKLPGIFSINQWHTVLCAVDRSVDMLILAGVSESTSRADNRVDVAIAAGSLANAATWSIGKNRTNSFNGKVLHATIVDGVTIEGRKFEIIAQEVAKVTWWDDARGGITP